MLSRTVNGQAADRRSQRRIGSRRGERLSGKAGRAWRQVVRRAFEMPLGAPHLSIRTDCQGACLTGSYRARASMPNGYWTERWPTSVLLEDELNVDEGVS